MNFLNDIPNFTWRLFIAFLSFAIAPGLIIIYIYNKELFLEIDFLKIISLSLSISLPVCLFNYMLCLIAFRQKKFIEWKPEEQSNFALLPILLSAIPFYLLIIIKFLFIDIEFKLSFILLLVFEFVLITVTIVFNRIAK